MKKLISLLLCLAMLACTLAGCSDVEDEDKGATIPVYLTAELRNFDPAYCYTDEGMMQLMGLLFQGLTKINSKGAVEGDLAKKWSYEVDSINDTYVLEFTLNKTYWSDGRQVSADDLVYAWKRIMEPEFHSEAASMLAEVKNAAQVKNGDVSIDDLGVYALDTTVFQVEFDHDIDVDAFLRYCASPALIPLREDAVNRVEDWSSNVSSLTTNGPFTIRVMTEEKMVLERNTYYYRDYEKDSLKKSVTPYRLSIDLTVSPEAQLTAFDAGELDYVGYIPLAQRSAYADRVKLEDTQNTHTYFFNTTKAPFDNANVRKALSMALDRNAIANLVVFAEPATGIVNGSGVFGSSNKATYRSEAGDLISSSADIAGAQSLINSAGVSVKDFAITVRGEDEVAKAIADYCAQQWSQLGFNVTVRPLAYRAWSTESEYDVYADTFSEAYQAGDFDVIAIDWEAISSVAFPTLASFAKQYAGGSMDLSEVNESGDFQVQPHITGYDDETYNALMDEIIAIKDNASRQEKLHEAEKMLVEAMPVMPLVTYKRAYLIGDDLAKTTQAPFRAFTIFSKAKKKSYTPDTTTGK